MKKHYKVCCFGLVSIMILTAVIGGGIAHVEAANVIGSMSRGLLPSYSNPGMTRYNTECTSISSLVTTSINNVSGTQAIGTGSVAPNCMDNISITTSDKVKVLCNNGSSFTLTGPGTFNASASSQCSVKVSNFNNRAGINTDFYSYTAHSVQFISATPANVCTITPSQVAPGQVVTIGNAEQSSKGGGMLNVGLSSTGGTSLSTTGTFVTRGQNFSMSFVTPGVPVGQYTVAVTQSGDSVCSNTLSLKVTAPAPVDATPTGLSANFSLSARNVSLSWSIPSGATISSIEVERADTLSDDVSIGAYNKVATLGADAASYIDDIKNLTSSFPLHYRIRAKLSDGSYSSFSNVAVVASCVNIEGSGQ